MEDEQKRQEKLTSPVKAKNAAHASQLFLWDKSEPWNENGIRVKRPHPVPGFQPRNIGTSAIIRLVLASGSSSKQQILTDLGIDFDADPADVDESLLKHLPVEDQVRDLARLKAEAIAHRHPGCLILGADTLISDHIGTIGKPKDHHEAGKILTRLEGNNHNVVSAIHLIDLRCNNRVTRICKTSIKFRALSPETIARYVRTGEPLGKAGAYALQGIGGLLIERVDGEYNNVLGLPVVTFVEALSDLGYELI